MPRTLVAQEQPISRIFSDDYVFYIPGYQRPYAWTTEQARELFEDLTGFVKSNTGDVSEMPPYFLGSIVLVKGEAAPYSDVVDGQQRLTTLTLLLSAIRASVSEQNAKDITPLIYEKGNSIRGTQDRFRVSLRERDREFFQKYVQREDGFKELLKLNSCIPDSQENIRANAILFKERIESVPHEFRLRLAQFIVTRCFLVVVATPDLDSAYRIFSVLNSRGLDLTATDILKAEIIGELPPNKRTAYTKKWEDEEEDLGRDSFGELFSHIRMVYRKAKPQGTLLKEFKEHVTEVAQPAKFIDDVLVPMSDAYEVLTDASYASPERAEYVNERLKWLNRLEFTDWVPPALAFTVRWRSNPRQMEQFFGDLERLTYSMLIAKFGINERIDRCSRLTVSIERGEELQEKNSPLQLTPNEQYTIYEILTGPIYGSLAARARSAVLLRLDSLLSGGGATYHYETVTVEHVLPQNPPETSQWIEWFPDPVQRAKHVHSLGNLALLTRKKNSAASNYEFKMKKETYFARGGVSPFTLTTQVLQHTTWTPEVVIGRQAELVGILEKHWRLEERKSLLEELASQTNS